jgi:hypothetical protein
MLESGLNLYFVSCDYIVRDSGAGTGILLTKRTPGEPSTIELERLLQRLHMRLCGDVYINNSLLNWPLKKERENDF